MCAVHAGETASPVECFCMLVPLPCSICCCRYCSCFSLHFTQGFLQTLHAPVYCSVLQRCCAWWITALT